MNAGPPRDEKGRVVKGYSLNPGGRPKGLAALAREKTRDGAELLEFWLEIMRDKSAHKRDRISASVEIANRGFGRPVDVTLTKSLDATDPQTSPLTVEQLEALASLSSDVLARVLGTGSSHQLPHETETPEAIPAESEDEEDDE